MTPPEQLFRPIVNLPVAGGLMILLGAPLPFIGWMGYRQDPNWAAALLIAGLGLCVAGVGLFLIVRFSGRFHLSPTTIRRVRFGRVTSLALADVTRFESHASQLVPFLRLHAPAGRLDIPSQLASFPELERALQTRLAHLRPAPPAGPPLTLRLPTRFYAGILLPLLGLMGLIGGLIRLAAGAQWQLAAGDILTFLGLFAGFIALVVLLDENGDPYRLELGETAVTAHYLHRTRQIPAADIQQIARVRHVRTYRGFSQVTYPIVLTHSGGRTLQIQERRAWQFGHTPESLLALLLAFYAPLAVAGRLQAGGRPREAARAYRAFLQADPEDAAAWRELGHCLLAVGQWQQAGDALDRAIRLAPDDDVTLFAAAQAFARQRSGVRARACLQRAIQLNPEHARAARLEPALSQLSLG